MGVTGLWKLIDQTGRVVPLESLENKVLAIDISIWLHQVVKGFQDSTGAALPHAHLLGLFHRLCKLLFYRIKPIFVFDGGVPYLKYETMRKRQQNKRNYRGEADRIQNLLVESLAREKIAQQALGGEDIIKKSLSPRKNLRQPNKSNYQCEKDDLFKLPPLPGDDEESFDSINNKITNLNDCFDKKPIRSNQNFTFNTIDVKSKHFQSLPADVRHEILTDIKDKRKESSWGRLHELPVDSDDFSEFQMKRLLKRRQVQVSLEDAEKEMGGKCMSLDELERFLMEEGVVKRNKPTELSMASDSGDCIDPNTVGKQIASDENTRIVHIKEIKKIIQENEVIENVEVENMPSPPKRAKLDESVNDELEEDMQLAIKLSLEQFSDDKSPELMNSSNDEVSEKCNRVKLRPEQKKVLAKAAKSLAKAYMLEYGGMNSDDIDDLVHISDEEPCQSEFKYNNLSMMDEKSHEVEEATEKLEREIINKNIETIKSNNSDAEGVNVNDSDDISSNADSDFIDVPEMNPELIEEFNIRAGFNDISCKPCDGDEAKDFRHTDLKIDLSNSEKKKILLEVLIKPDTKLEVDDDLFADVFVANEANKNSEIIEKSHENADLNKLHLNIENINKKETSQINISNDLTIKLDKIENTTKTSTTKPSLNDILINLDKEMNNLNEINLDISLSKPILTETNVSTIEISDTSDDDGDFNGLLQKNAPKTPIKTKQTSLSSFLNITPKKSVSTASEEKYPQESPVTPKVTSPFFRKKTPTSSSRKKNQLITEETNSNIENHSKVSKSLFNEIVENQTVPSLTATTTITEENAFETAANVLRDLKTTDELTEIITEANQKSKTLELERNKQQRLGKSITEQMSDDCKQLLRLFGIPYIVAPMEAEAQCAFFDMAKITDGTITDDSDIWLFGGQTVYKNFFDQKKNVSEYRFEIVEKSFNIERAKLIQLAMLVGSDYTTGITGIGAVTALEILASFPIKPIAPGETNEIMSLLSTLLKFKEWWLNEKKTSTTTTKSPGKIVVPTENIALRKKLKNIEIFTEFPSQNVAEAYLYPQINDSREAFTWGTPDPETLREFAKTTFGWTYSRTDELIQPVLKKFNEKKTQISIKNYFKTNSFSVQKDVAVSKRIRLAINKMSKESTVENNDRNNDDDDVILVDDDEEKNTTKKSKGTVKNKSKEINIQNNKKRSQPKSLKSNEPKSKKSLTNVAAVLSSPSSSSSSSSSSLASQKKSKIPDFKPPIAQKEKQQKIEEDNKKKAIKLFKQSMSKNNHK